MSRYLTSSKIGLLALISLYTESVVPSAATVPVLSLLVSHILPSTSKVVRTESELYSQHNTLAINEFQGALKGHVSGIPGRTVWDLFLHKLWKINSFDALHVFYDTLSLLLQKTPKGPQNEVNDYVDPHPNRMLLARTSPLGSFVRRAQLEFTRLPFHDSVTLWKTFIAYRAPTLLQWKKRNPTAGFMSFDTNLRKYGLSQGDPLTEVVYGEFEDSLQQQSSVSTADVERLLDHQVDNMQSESIRHRLILIKSWSFNRVQEWAIGYPRR